MSTGGIAAHGSDGELTGRIVFGIGAALLADFALYVWKRLLSRRADDTWGGG